MVDIQEFLLLLIMWMIHILIFLHITDIHIGKWYLKVAICLFIIPAYYLNIYPYAYSPILFVIVYYLCRGRGTYFQYAFYAFFPAVTIDIFSRVMALFLIIPLLEISPEELNKDYLLLYISFGAVVSLYYFFNKVLDLNFKKIHNATNRNKKYFSKLFIVFQVIYYFLFIIIAILRVYFPSFPNVWDYRQLILMVSMMIYLMIIAEINFEAKLEMDQKLEKARQDKIKALEDYNYQIELSYEDIREFKKEYDNTVNHLKKLIEKRDIEAIRENYNRIIQIQNNRTSVFQYELGRLTNLKISPLKSILSTKMIEAQSQNVEAFLEIPDIIDEIHLEVLDLVIVLSVFLDNAIEAAKESYRPHISVAFFERGESQFLVIENSISKESVTMSKIFQEGYSTKGPNRGIGLANVRQILDNYPKILLSTKMGQHNFTQILEMRPES